eukprot:augustus_masked-scaffold_8-processed-gene-7.8-mRNA-1 protein AED:0.25 eAED:1.00 QI:0/-1/0/1/-1/1/1/0/172
MKTYPHRIAWYNTLGAGSWMVIFVFFAGVFTGDYVDFSGLKGLEFWKFLGGPLGTSFVFASIILAPRIGMGVMVTVAIAGQLVGSLVIDSLGLIGAAKIDLTPIRVLGVGIVYIAVILFRFEGTIKKLLDSEDEEELKGSKLDDSEDDVESTGVESVEEKEKREVPVQIQIS